MAEQGLRDRRILKPANFLLKEISKKKKGNLSSFRNINQDQYVKLQYKFVEVDCYVVEKVQVY